MDTASQTAGALPKHVEIAEALIRRIGAGLLPDGARLPPERVMASDCGVAVGTLRKALAALDAEGLLERVQGSGNYIRHRAGARSVYGLFRLELTSGGGLPTAQVLSVDRLARPAAAPAFGSGAEAFRIRRLRRLDGRPVALEEIWMDGGRSATLTAADLSDSLYESWLRLFGLTITGVEDRVGVDPLPGWAPADFPLGPGIPAGHAERLSTAGEAGPVEYSRTWFDSGRARFVSRTGGTAPWRHQ